MAEGAPPTVHAGAILLGSRAVVLRGPSGCGKSRLALELLADAEAHGIHAALIGDDRVSLAAHAGRLVVRAPPVIAGRIEVRGVGLVDVAHEPAGVVALIVDLVVDRPDRLPEPETVVVEGVAVARLALWREDPAPVRKVLIALSGAPHGTT